MAQQLQQDEAGNVWDTSGSVPVFVRAAGGSGMDTPQAAGDPNVVQGAPNLRRKQDLDLAEAVRRATEAARNAPIDTAIKQAQLGNLTNPRSAPPSGYRFNAAGNLEKIPGGPGDKKPGGSGALDSLVNQIKETQRLFREGPGQTKGIAGIKDLLPGSLVNTNGQFDVAASQLEDQAATAFKVPGMGAQSDADAARIARSSKPDRFNSDAANEQLFKGLRARVDAMRASQGLPPADWNAQEAAAMAQGVAPSQQQQPAAMIPGAGTPPQPPQGPAGYDVGSVAGAPTGAPSAGGNFASAAGVAMAKKLSDAYTRGAGVQELNTLLADNGFQTFSDPATIAAIAKRGRLNFAPPVADDTRGAVGKVLGSMADSAGGAYAMSAADALTAGTLDNIAGGQSGLAMDYARQQYPGASLAGTVTGGALAAGGAELGLARAGLTAGRAALGGDALYGAAYGAGSTDDGGSRMLGALGGGVGGLAGGMAGRGLARGVGSAFRGVQNADARGLRAAGVPLTTGQALGGVAKGVEDRLSGVPVIGSMVNARRLEGMQGFNRAAFDEGLTPIGANTGGLTQEAGIDAAQNATRQGYDTALDGVSVTRDPQFTGDYNGAIAQGSQVPRVGPEFEAWARSDLDPLTAQPQYDGATIQDFIQQTRGADFGNDAMGNLVGRSVTGAEDAMRGLVNRQAPDVMPALGRADQAYRQVQVLKDAVNRARNGTRVGETGTFAPSQLADAAAANAKKFGNSQGTTHQPFFNLTRAGQAVLPNSVPDSGTAGRVLTQQALGAAGLGVLGGTGGYAAGGEDGAQALGLGGLAVGGTLALGGSRAAQRAIVASLMDRSPALVRAGNGIANRARIGGLFGAPMLASGGAYLAAPQ
jgi:hypothetical protein